MLVLSVLQLVLVFVLVVPSVAQPTGRLCPPAPGRSETCVCQTDEGIIDLTDLSNYHGGARFSGLKDPNGYTYYYNPCHSYNAGGEGCDVDYICQEAGLLSFNIGSDGTEEMWIDTDGTPYLYYTGDGSREAKVFLHCNESATSPIATTDGDYNVTDHYVFHITAREVCSGRGGGQTGTLCPSAPGRSETCVCQTDKGIIDLTGLSNNNGEARFPDLQDPRGYAYYYNPCHAYNAEDQGCSDYVYICQQAGPQSRYDIGKDLTEEMWIDTDGTPYLYYAGSEGRKAKVFLHCDETASTMIATTNGDINVTDHYVFDIMAREVCPGEGGVHAGNTTGVIIAIAFVALIVSAVGIAACVVFGVVLFKGVKKRTGYERVN